MYTGALSGSLLQLVRFIPPTDIKAVSNSVVRIFIPSILVGIRKFGLQCPVCGGLDYRRGWFGNTHCQRCEPLTTGSRVGGIVVFGILLVIGFAVVGSCSAVIITNESMSVLSLR